MLPFDIEAVLQEYSRGGPIDIQGGYFLSVTSYFFLFSKSYFFQSNPKQFFFQSNTSKSQNVNKQKCLIEKKNVFFYFRVFVDCYRPKTCDGTVNVSPLKIILL